eukprot:CAMPEP_0198353350 /NCGR_PEP_ID=MMETSP1450-20131203/111005_1 /TAXON_ID=753684 ORGANISM="Madagascaria erythrocladiodes, Strain CCMP3234" /NCGR_SAMPLE_ID=MMETSP1450 /ASSEMBLY_ACC=CAM_ASM_001115 /LENGTH=272 /DNA_ID=CAMNT_0044059477 /DNA_START=17 /DNA_END=835 /DNA_ORIENTATION=-
MATTTATGFLVDAAALDTLQSIFPAHTPASLRAVLEAHNNHVERAAEYLLSQPPPTDPQTTSSDGDNPYGFDDDDDAYIPNFNFADPAQRREIVNNIKEIVVPGLCEQLTEMVIPDVDNETDRMKFSLRRVQVQSLNLRPEDVDVETLADGIRVRVADFSVELDVAAWSFERTAMPRLRDSGAARVSLSAVSASMSMLPNNVPGEPEVRMTDPEVHIGQIRLRFAESRAAWIYNAIAMTFRPVIKAVAERALRETIASAVEGQVDDWSDWIE